MDLVVADDCKHSKPSRRGLTGIDVFGGFVVSGDAAASLERELDARCREAGFPPGEEFKWSPGKKQWMRDHLRDERRARFFETALTAAKNHEVVAHVAVVETSAPLAVAGASSIEASAIWLFMERTHVCLRQRGQEGLVIFDTPGGGREKEMRFLGDSARMLEEGTRYQKFDRFALNVLTGSSSHIRLLQLADLITSCSGARVAGDQVLAPRIFPSVLPLLRRDGGRAGGVGLKIWPDEYMNLYHWLLGERSSLRGGTRSPLPDVQLWYADAEEVERTNAS